MSFYEHLKGIASNRGQPLPDEQTYMQRCKVVTEWLADNFSPWATEQRITSAAIIGGTCMFLAAFTIAASTVGANADKLALEVLRESFNTVRRRIRESGILDPGAAFGAPGGRK